MLLSPCYFFFFDLATCDDMCNLLISRTAFPAQQDPGDGMLSWLDYAAAAHKALHKAFERKPPCET